MAGVTHLKYIEEIKADIVRALKPLGKQALIEAYKIGHTDAPRNTTEYTGGGSYKWRHRTGNLHDSFASGVFVDGVLVQSSVQYLDNPISRTKDRKTGKTGRQTVKDYLRRVSFGAKNGEIVLVVVAAMYYTRILEGADNSTSSRGPSGRYIVITPAKDYIAKNWWSYVEPVYKKHGLPIKKPASRVIKGENIRV